MTLKRLIPSVPPLLRCHSGIRDILLSGPRHERRLFHQTSRQASKRGYEEDLRRHLHNTNIHNAKPLLTAAQARQFARSPRTHVFFGGCALAAAIFYFSNLETVPVSGRRRFNCYGDGVSTLSDQEVKRVIYEAERRGLRTLPEYDNRTMMVKQVMSRLIPISGLGHYDWEIRVIDNPREANAFVLPGGKVFVYSGILPITRNQDGLAAVLGHEIAHNLAQHHGERLSATIGPNILMYGLIFLTAPIPGALFATQALGGWLLDTLFGRPMSRKMESEADYIGLMLMAEACYDPREAVAFWQRMERAVKFSGDAEIAEWMSTHPSHQSRVEKITEWLPEALEKGSMSDCHGTSDFARLFQQALGSGILYPG